MDIINFAKIQLSHVFQVNDCGKFTYLKEGLEKVIVRIRNRKTVLLIQANPWIRHLPIIGWHGYGEIRADCMKIINFVSEEIREHKKEIDYDSEPTTFTAAYLQEIRKREQSGNKDSFS